jgi:hypothetical protein
MSVRRAEQKIAQEQPLRTNKNIEADEGRLGQCSGMTPDVI